VNVWMGTGSMSTIAYIKWLQSYVSRNNRGQMFLPDPADPMIYTLSGITTGSSITGEIVHTTVGNNAVVFMESTTSIYYGELGTNQIPVRLCRKGLFGNSTFDSSMFFTGSNNSLYFASVVDGEIYGLSGYGVWGDSGNRTLLLYDMNNGTITQKYTDVGDYLESWNSLMVIGNPGEELLVAMSTCGTGSAYNGWVRVFDATDGSLIRKTGIIYKQVSYPEANRGTVALSYYTSPQIYDGKIIYSFLEEWQHDFHYPWIPPDYYAWTGVIVYDPSNGSYGVARVQNDYNLFRHVSILEAGMDYTSGYYYWLEVQTEPAHPSGIEEYRLYRSTVSLSPSIALIENPDVDDNINFVTGKERLYSVYTKTGNIKKTATAELVGNAPYSLTGANDFASQLDEPDQRIWFVNNINSVTGTLCGISVIGEDDKIITLTNGTFVDNPMNSMNLVNRGVVFTSSSKIGLAQG